MGHQGRTIDMKALKRIKSSGKLMMLIVLGSLLVLPACQFLNPLEAPSSVSRLAPPTSNFPVTLKWQQSLDCTSVLPPQAWGEILIVPNNHCRNMGRFTRWMFDRAISYGKEGVATYG
jgi:hypothetical protein